MYADGRQNCNTQRVVSLRMKANSAADELLLTDLYRVLALGIGNITVSSTQGSAARNYKWTAIPRDEDIESDA